MYEVHRGGAQGGAAAAAAALGWARGGLRVQGSERASLFFLSGRFGSSHFEFDSHLDTLEVLSAEEGTFLGGAGGRANHLRLRGNRKMCM